MSRRMEIELTSHAEDGSWTWRAAGARQPRGTVTVEFVPDGASVGDVFRAEIESTIEGIEVTAVLPPKPTRSVEQNPKRIEVIGAPQSGPDVSVTLASGKRRRPDDDHATRRDRPPRRDDGGRRPGPGRRGPEGPDKPRSEGDRSRSTERRGANGDRGRPPSDRGRPTGDRGRGPSDHRPGPSERRERRPSVSTAFRNAALAELRPEQLPVAEQLVRGGLPAVRQAIEEQNVRAKAEGKPAPAADALLKMAEELLPVVRLADWKDRATSAQLAGKEFRLRELRAVVAASRTVILDEEGKALAKALQESLGNRVTGLREEWVNRISTAITEGRVLDALRISTRAPEPGTRCPADLAVSLTAAAGAAMTAETDPAEWMALLGAVVDSPVRRTVKPAGIPAGEEVQAAAHHAAGLVPELAKLLGLRIPPPPPRRVPSRPLSPMGGGAPKAGP